MNIQEFLEKTQLKIESVKLLADPREDSNFGKDASHFQIKISSEGRGAHTPLVTFYSMGSANKGKPKLDCVLECLSSDASCALESFNDFCGNMGYSVDSRSAHKMYLACQLTGRQLKDLLKGNVLGIQDLLEVEW